jgi:PST family polysaccharide transporter
VFFREEISFWTFRTDRYAREVGLLSLGVFMMIVTGSQGAFLNGLRRIGDLARILIASSLLITVFSIIVTLALREKGIVYLVIGFAAATYFITQYYSTKAVWTPADISLRQLLPEIGNLFSLGVVFMASGDMANATQYVVRIIIQKALGLESVGLFHAAWILSSVYVGFIMESMIKDFYPRLTAVSVDHQAMNRLVNEQVEASLILSVPIILGMMTFATLAIRFLYAATFDSAIPVVQWQIMGTLFQVVSWPVNYVIVAKERALIYFLTEFSWNRFFTAFIWLRIPELGLVSTGIGYCTAYLAYLGIVYVIAFLYYNEALALHLSMRSVANYLVSFLPERIGLHLIRKGKYIQP